MNEAQAYDRSANGVHDGLCPQCQRGQLNSRHCKAICELCGYVESCEDIFPQMPDASDSQQSRVKPSGPTVVAAAQATHGSTG